MLEKVVFKRRHTNEVDTVPIVDAQLIYDMDTGKTYMDVGDKRIPTGKGSDIVIDPALINEGQAADAKATGEALRKKIDAPVSSGSAGQVLTNDGAGGTEWADSKGSETAVLYTPQELKPEQKEQARKNIGADSTLTKPGEAADAKTTGDTINEQRDWTIRTIGNRFEKSAQVVACNPWEGTDLDVVSTIGHPEITPPKPVTAVKLRQTGHNIYDCIGHMGGAGKTETKDGITCVLHDDGTATLNGVHAVDGWTNFFNVTIPARDRFLYPAGDYYIPQLTGYKSCGFSFYAYEADGTGVTRDIPFHADQPFSIAVARIGVHGQASFDNVTVPCAVYYGKQDYRETRYAGEDYVVTFKAPVYGGSYDWAKGELISNIGADGAPITPVVTMYEPKRIVAQKGTNTLVSSCGVPTKVSGYQISGQELGAGGTLYDKSLAKYAPNVMEYQNYNTLTVGMMADSHVDYSKDYHAIYDAYFDDLQNASDYINQDAIVYLGDVLTIGYEDKVQPLKTLEQFAYQFCRNNKRTPIGIIRGNHDDNCYGPRVNGVQQVNKAVNVIVSKQEWHNRITTRCYPYAVFPENTAEDVNYFYIDNARTKVRMFCLDSEDFPDTVIGDNYQWESYHRSQYGVDQVKFVAKALLFADKGTDAKNWAALFFSHRPLDLVKNSGQHMGLKDAVSVGANALWYVITAYRNGKSLKLNQTDPVDKETIYTITADYSVNGPGEVIATIAGHTHTDNTSDKVALPASKCYGYRFITIGTVGAVNIVVDRANHLIHVIKQYGKKAYVFDDPANPTVIKGLKPDDIDEKGRYTVGYTTY